VVLCGSLCNYLFITQSFTEETRRARRETRILNHCLNYDFRVIFVIFVIIKNHINHTNHLKACTERSECIIVQTSSTIQSINVLFLSLLPLGVASRYVLPFFFRCAGQPRGLPLPYSFYLLISNS